MSRRRRRGARGGGTGLVTFGVLAVAVLLAVRAVQWLAAHGWVLVVLGLLALSAAAAWCYARARRIQAARLRTQGLAYSIEQIDAMHHSAFEIAIRDLLARDGSRDALRCGGRGDLGADVKGHDPLGRLWVIQCKHRGAGLNGSAVGTPDLQTLNGTGRPVHRGDVVVMVTNGRVTQPARAFARQQRLHLVDRRVLQQWARGARPLWEILPAVPPPRPPARLRRRPDPG
ncbi:restriction endonuclease [Streptomyces longispororuber]|uniref:restriction endonuclease n=1 Tax=Streptomyces longispororuber TaxID=68230 RepID=UPI003700EEA0